MMRALLLLWLGLFLVSVFSSAYGQAESWPLLVGCLVGGGLCTHALFVAQRSQR